ncbi:hypothetical protein [Methylocaldum sp.]|uniref:hypothetical protein n=1 Tax=Methylocaldum sp. TaxID=1969727 RepID=UPI002D6B605F|nr:hypothetical protein [Methylocaldum sp.]HYE35514.1 hypothetical protein [Methylocaldum sp.]
MKITLEHARVVGYCARGMRAFAKRHGLDWERFRAEGLPEEELLETNDAMAERCVEAAHEAED